MLSQRLKMPMSELFAEQSDRTESAVTARRSIGRVADAIRVNTPNYDYYYLCPELRRKRMIPVLGRVRAKSLKEFGELIRHPGEEHTFVVEGRVTLHTEFYNPIVLETGESVYIDSNMGHAYLAGEGCKEAVVLSVCSSEDESLMESLLNLHGPENIGSSGPEAASTTPPAKPRRRPKTAGGKPIATLR